jgi:hypothetical protein
MKIPEIPTTVEQLGLMKQLEDYAEGRASWLAGNAPIGPKTRKACRELHTQIVKIVDRVFASILDRVTARELDTFTMHDRSHGLKVAHLMWHILSAEARAVLTPPEIGLMVLSAYLHDAGMALSKGRRTTRLAPESDLWELVEINPSVKRNLDRLSNALREENIPEPKRRRLAAELFQAEEALLALDTRGRHAKRERYTELIDEITQYHDKDRAQIPDIEECLSFEGDSFKAKLIEICVSHNQEADVLVEQDRENFERPRFPRDYPVGSSTADLHLVAAALRLADILDFDRERTPSVLFHYLLPTSLRIGDDISTLDWRKHLAISSWEIESEAIVFRGRSKSHIVHHAIIQFCRATEDEIATTRSTFAIPTSNLWQFSLPAAVRADIHAEGYRYVPYRFELDENRIYELLMGGAIYENPLVAVRELIQNSVDACNYRDALSKLYEPSLMPDMHNRIIVRYEEPSPRNEYPTLSVTDTGTGMDAWVIERWFLKVGRSLYSSTEFARDRQELRKKGLDFAPVSEFGIGFLSCFLLADRVEVETAMWEPVRGDTRKRHLEIDGPTRLIRIRETPNEGISRFRGTRVSLHLTPRRGKVTNDSSDQTASWQEVLDYLKQTCLALPYRITAEHTWKGTVTTETIEPVPLRVELPPPYSEKAIHIPISNEAFGIEGEVAFVPSRSSRQIARDMMQESPIVIGEPQRISDRSFLLRGGFNIGDVPGMPYVHDGLSGAIVSLGWKGKENHHYLATNLSRTGIIAGVDIGLDVTQMWIRYLIDNKDKLPDGFQLGLTVRPGFGRGPLVAKDNLWLDHYNLLELYDFARLGWHAYNLEFTKSRDPVGDWESKKVRAIYIPIDLYLFGWMLSLILPRVVPIREMDAEGRFYATTLVDEWREILQSSKNFASSAVHWPPFALYVGTSASCLYNGRGSSGENPMNSRYADRLTTFTNAELWRLPKLFDRLSTDRYYQRPSQFGTADAALLERALAAVGDLEIRTVWLGDPLDSLVRRPF